MLKGMQRTHAVHAPQHTAEPAQVFRIVQFGGATATTRVEGEAVTLKVAQGLARRIRERCDYRDFLGGQFLGKVMLLLNGGVIPATRAVKLGDQKAPFGQTHLIDAVFIAVQCQQ